jgi:uncharacterized membrane protein (DUF373 family)
MRHIVPRWSERARAWRALTFYQQFESAVALVLTVVVALVVLVALYRVTAEILGGLVFGALNPLDHRVFQNVFGEILTLLIALEFNHTLQHVVTRQQSLIQTRVVLSIALLALARKFIVLDLNAIDSEQLLALAAITLALGIVYWVVRESDDRVVGTREVDTIVRR